MQNNLLRIRHQKKLKQSELAKQTGLTQGYISKFEKGFIADPHLSTLRRLAQALRCQVKDIVSLDGSRTRAA